METTFLSLEYRVSGIAAHDVDMCGDPESYRIELRSYPPESQIGDRIELVGMSREDLRRFPLGAIVKLNLELPPFPLPLPDKNEDTSKLADRLCAKLVKYAGEQNFSGKGGTSEGAVDVLERLLNELEGYRGF